MAQASTSRLSPAPSSQNRRRPPVLPPTPSSGPSEAASDSDSDDCIIVEPVLVVQTTRTTTRKTTYKSDKSKGKQREVEVVEIEDEDEGQSAVSGTGDSRSGEEEEEVEEQLRPVAHKWSGRNTSGGGSEEDIGSEEGSSSGSKLGGEAEEETDNSDQETEIPSLGSEWDPHKQFYIALQKGTGLSEDYLQLVKSKPPNLYKFGCLHLGDWKNNKDSNHCSFYFQLRREENDDDESILRLTDACLKHHPKCPASSTVGSEEDLVKRRDVVELKREKKEGVAGRLRRRSNPEVWRDKSNDAPSVPMRTVTEDPSTTALTSNSTKPKTKKRRVLERTALFDSSDENRPLQRCPRSRVEVETDYEG